MKGYKNTVFKIVLSTVCLATMQQGWSKIVDRQALGADFKALQTATPFQNNNGNLPSPGQSTFVLNHAWPTTPLPPLKNAPWQQAIGNGKITTANAHLYANALKAAVAVNGTALITKGNQFNAVAGHWYNEPWLGSQREAIQGTYSAGEFGPSIFPGTGLRATFGTHVLTYYDERAASTLYNFWGPTAMKPNFSGNRTQFAEGSIVVKAAVFASTDPKQPTNWWDAMSGAQQWNLLLCVPDTSQPTCPSPLKVWPGYIAQFDIIVKDSQSSPKTGWVFMTLVYDNRIKGDPWSQMVPLGVQWGNDPQATNESMPLTENWNNPAAPLYSTQTLGWGGRLSGPNDGGRNDIAVDGKIMKNAPNSSCMSCHSTSQWNTTTNSMPTFLLPSLPASKTGPKSLNFMTCGADGKPDPTGNGPYICSPAPGSTLWMKWFQNRLGDQPMDAGSVATDFDEVFAFKSLKLWWLAVGPTNQPMPALYRPLSSGRRFNQYTGAPLPTP